MSAHSSLLHSIRPYTPDEAHAQAEQQLGARQHTDGKQCLTIHSTCHQDSYSKKPLTGQPSGQAMIASYHSHYMSSTRCPMTQDNREWK